MEAQVALVTGASRGIGKACAIALAGVGYDVAIAARTVTPGEIRDNTITIHRSDTRPLPGSLEETAAEIHAAGRRSLILPMDLLDRAAVGAGMTTVLERWGRVDLLLHNGRYIGTGDDGPVPRHTDRRLREVPRGARHRPADPDQDGGARHVGPRVGVIMTMGSGAAYNDPPARPARGASDWRTPSARPEACGWSRPSRPSSPAGAYGRSTSTPDTSAPSATRRSTTATTTRPGRRPPSSVPRSPGWPPLLRRSPSTGPTCTPRIWRASAASSPPDDRQGGRRQGAEDRAVVVDQRGGVRGGRRRGGARLEHLAGRRRPGRPGPGCHRRQHPHRGQLRDPHRHPADRR